MGVAPARCKLRSDGVSPRIKKCFNKGDVGGSGADSLVRAADENTNAIDQVSSEIFSSASTQGSDH